MKSNFSCALTGNKIWKRMLGFIVLFLAVLIPLELTAFRIFLPGTGNIPVSLVFILVLLVLFLNIASAWIISLFRIALPTISLKNEAFAFTGFSGAFLKTNLFVSFLSIITLGVFFPRYSKKFSDYCASNTEYRGIAASFSGLTGTLRKYYMLSLVLPVLAWILCVLGLISAADNVNTDTAVALGWLTTIACLAFCIVIVPFVYFFYKWCVNLNWNQTHIVSTAEFLPSVLFLSGQIALTLITAGIYFPAFCIKAWKFFAEKTVLMVDGQVSARLGFEGKTGAGFIYIWGQQLLSMITMGIFYPWAYSACIRYFINGTFIDDEQIIVKKQAQESI